MMTAMTFMTAKMDDVMDTVMDDRAKRDHNDLSTAANSSEQQSPKKSDTKPTPTKKSRRPSLEKAAKRQVP
jgi:spore germination cell wall hydrolase CwlJ-like protein